ncbi:OprO/OprP family phosphate-selective porin [Polymorphobacter arshaanensis]|uniref:OprO/OprP family phosphate-selective porin n=1 Tax=Glacieibacterium arshaanense TaxID=2511025 RepID=UPI00140B6682|nr:porin [Polymorphobacter arshaanensis]
MSIIVSATTVLAAAPAFGAPAKATAPDLGSIIAAQQKQIDALAAEVAALRAQQAKAPAAASATAGPPAISTTQLASQQAQIDSVNAKVAQNAPAWRGGPQFNGNGFSFKPGGEVQYDFGYVSNPNNALATSNLGYNGFVRRLMVSAQGDVPGGFTYSINLNFAGGVVGYEDVILAYQPVNSKWSAQIGYMIPFNGLDNMTSNEFTSFVEASQFQDAWNNGRRIGAAVGYTADTWLIDAGLFNGAINTQATNTEWQTAVRGVYYPRALGGQLHFGASYQYRKTQVSAQGNLYQARPFTQTTSVRFVGTGPANNTGTIASGIAASGDQIFGAELAGIWGPLHFAAEAQYLMVAAIKPGQVLPPGQASTGQRLLNDPSFFSVYGEIGYWLTGETRGYSKGEFARTNIRNPFDKGGWGGVQLVGRIDYLNLTKWVGGTGSGIVAGVLNGGQQTGYQLALNWWPTDFVRFTTQYDRAQITGGPNAGAVDPTSTSLLTDRSYGVNVVTLRAQLDF